MLEAVIKHGILIYAMGIAMAAGIFAKVISHITAGKLVRAASEIQKSNHRLMRLVKAKFEHASMVSDKVQNVSVFVQKYLYEYKVLGVRLGAWESLQKKMVWLIIAFGILGVLASYQLYGMNEQTFQCGSFAATYAVILFSIHILSNEKAKLDAAKNYMVDYLENVCIHRYEKASQIVKSSEEEGLPEAAEVKPEPELVKAPEFSKESEPAKERDEQEMRIRAILEEFLA